MARKPFSDLDELNARYRKAVEEAGWSPGMDAEVKIPRMGRPRQGERRIAITVTLSATGVAMLDHLSDEYHIPRGRILDRLLEEMRTPLEPGDDSGDPLGSLKRKRR